MRIHPISLLLVSWLTIACTETKSVVACGDDFLDPGEQCDGAHLSVGTCSELGYYLQNGQLGCNPDCTLDLTVCALSCGDGLIQALYGEQCEGDDLGGASCENQGLGGGTLSCNDRCHFDSSGCEVHAICGDGAIMEPFEQCEQDQLGGHTCVELGWYDGTLACGQDCRFDLDSCRTFGKCGDATIQALYGEECEGAELDGASCESLGQYAGTLRCQTDCTFDLSSCGGICGDDVAQTAAGEICDGADLDGQDCSNHGQYPGTLACASDCGAFVLDACGGFCGDGVIQEAHGETCDGVELGDSICLDFERFFGEPACDDACVAIPGTCRAFETWGSSAQEQGRSVAIDSAGNIYVAGYTEGAMDGQTSAGVDDAFLTRYGPDGVRLWTRQWGTSLEDQAYGVAVDASGNVFVTGHTRSTLDGQTQAGRTDVFLSCFSPDGTRLWTRLWGSSLFDYGLRVAADGAGAVYVAGYTESAMPGATSAGSIDYFLLKVSAADGSTLWIRQGGNSSENNLGGLALVPGGVFVTGTTFNGLDDQPAVNGGWTPDVYLVRYDTDGNRLWTRVWGSDTTDSLPLVDVDATGVAYVTGRTMGSMDGNLALGSDDFFLTRFEPDGTKSWTRQWGTSQADHANHVQVLPNGTVLVAGACYGILPGQASFGNADIALSRFEADGTLLEALQTGSTTADVPRCIAVDPAGHVFTTGVTSNAVGTTSGEDVFLLFLPQ